PWQNQLRAARDRNEQTQVQYLDPNDDPLRRRPQRQPQPQPPQHQPQQPPQYQQPPQRRQQQQPQRYAPPPPPQHQQPQAPPPQQRYAPPQQPAQSAPRPPREPRRSNPNRMRIPGLGCLKGCLFTVVLMFVAAWLIWELTPLQDWIGSTKGFFEQIGDTYNSVSKWVEDLGGSTK
ncbi:MAG TPA: serine/threonine protein kinase, partial [Streptomyces sp.]|nr:serine/threonine protein kinase [Streptomyces sp.]